MPDEEQSGPDINQSLAFLAGELDRVSDVLASQTAQGSVWACAVLALVRTHPDPSAFAAAFRRYWQKAGEQHSNDGVLSEAQVGYSKSLGDLERVCQVRLGVRPPGRAADPES